MFFCPFPYFCPGYQSIFFFFFFFFAFFHQVATDVIKEFAADGVKYLELRSTPREEKDTGVDVSMIA